MESVTEDLAVLEDELISNQRVVYIEPFGEIILRRPTPAEERKISEERRKSYHADLKNPEILTRKQLENILAERGAWTVEDKKKMEELSQRSTQLVTQLTILGFKSAEVLLESLTSQHDELKELLAGKGVEEEDKALELLGKLFMEDNDAADRMFILKDLRKFSAEPVIVDLLNDMESNLIVLQVAKDFSEVKVQLNEKLKEFSEYFAHSAESRADQAERIAKVFYCTRLKETNEPLWSSIEEAWDESPETFAILMNALFCFENGITDEVAETLERYGFMGRVSGTKPSLENSPDHPMSNSDGESVESEPQISSDADTPTS